MQKDVITLLLAHGADPAIANQKEQKPVNLCIQNENYVGIQLLLQEVPFHNRLNGQQVNKKNHFVYYLVNLACRGKHQLGFVWRKLQEVDDRVLRVELNKPDLHGFQFLVFLVKKYTQSIHETFIKYYNIFQRQNLYPLNHQKWKENGNDPAQLTRNSAFVYAFLEFLEYEDLLINVINFLIDMGSDPNAIVLEPRL